MNMAPADLKKEGASYDLSLAIGILAASGQAVFKDTDQYLVMGELSLDGSIRPIKGVLPIAIEARKRGFKGFVLPRSNAREAAVVDKLDVYGMDHFTQAVDFLSGKLALLQDSALVKKEYPCSAQLCLYWKHWNGKMLNRR